MPTASLADNMLGNEGVDLGNTWQKNNNVVDKLQVDPEKVQDSEKVHDGVQEVGCEKYVK